MYSDLEIHKRAMTKAGSSVTTARRRMDTNLGDSIGRWTGRALWTMK
jgi:hypothetical protein